METEEKRTITQAISMVLKAEDKPMAAGEIYDAIISSKLYPFKADKPVHVVSTQIRRHCKGLNFASASETKYFGIQNGKYFLLDQYIETKLAGNSHTENENEVSTNENDLLTSYAQYRSDLKQRISADLRKLDPYLFEELCKIILSAHDFEDAEVTKKSRDLGIDGHGKLTGGMLGISGVKVGFQCKRKSESKVGREEIDRFRGSLHAKYQLGIFFTTTDFTAGAKADANRRGSVPIFLINGEAIVNIMLEKKLIPEDRNLIVYNYSLDLIFEEN